MQTELNVLAKAGRWAEMPALVGDDQLEALTVRGDPEVVAERLVTRYGKVADRAGFYLPYGADARHVTDIITAVRGRS
jgi:hypothetical protein